jgi:hypothetical protein
VQYEKRSFAVDVLICEKCLGPMTVIAYLTDPAVVGKILLHLGLPTCPPRNSHPHGAPARPRCSRTSLRTGPARHCRDPAAEGRQECAPTLCRSTSTI